MLSHACRGLGALLLRWVLHPAVQALLGSWQRWLWGPPATGCWDSGAGCCFPEQYPSSCAMALVVAPVHGLTLALFLLHQPQGPGHQPAWDCAQCQDAVVRVTPAWHGVSQGSGVHPGQALTVPLPPLTSSCPVMLVVGDNAPAEEGVVSDGVVPVGWHTDGAHVWARSCLLPAQTRVSSRVPERAHVQTYLLVWAHVHVHLCLVATPGKPPLPHMPRHAHNVHTQMCWHTSTRPAWLYAPKQLLAHACACTYPHGCPHLHNQPRTVQVATFVHNV